MCDTDQNWRVAYRPNQEIKGARVELNLFFNGERDTRIEAPSQVRELRVSLAERMGDRWGGGGGLRWIYGTPRRMEPAFHLEYVLRAVESWLMYAAGSLRAV